MKGMVIKNEVDLVPTDFYRQPEILKHPDLTFQTCRYNYEAPCCCLYSLILGTAVIKQRPRSGPILRWRSPGSRNGRGGKCLLLLAPTRLSSRVGELLTDGGSGGALDRFECLLECNSTTGGSVFTLPGHGIATETSLQWKCSFAWMGIELKVNRVPEDLYLAIRSVASSSDHFMNVRPVDNLTIRWHR
ncbi:hypothetical protein ACJIZ3_024125 [Penstemon smallii]|uniref:Uncharacterized protein n=1 Tax=Penstemon smallii TaxID=265156 RepID=A0ABD3TQZ7_9LAMI